MLFKSYFILCVSVVVDVNSTANQFKQMLTVMSPPEAIDAIIRLVYID